MPPSRGSVFFNKLKAILISKVRRVYEGAGPRLQARSRLRAAVETVHRSAIEHGLAEIEAMATELEPAMPGQHGIRSAEELRPLLAHAQRQGKRVVFTNGCFDILHLGHVRLLQEARSFGDVLVVGVNADASVSRLKGPHRPINPEYDRAYLLSSLACVDYAVVFDQDTPYELIKTLQPDILVKGADYTVDTVVGADLVPEVRLVNLVEGKSTTSIIQKSRTA
jgi:D-beta-D-heptose 7-phosphate kinase/D-beta-D-heptose 1-phosphate adenosyltransferase